MTYRFEWNELPEDRQTFFLFEENTAFVRQGNTMVEVATRIAYPLPDQGIWWPHPEVIEDPYRHFCVEWEPYYGGFLRLARRAQASPVGYYKWSQKTGSLLGYDPAQPQERSGIRIGHFAEYETVQKAAYEHFIQIIKGLI